MVAGRGNAKTDRHQIDERRVRQIYIAALEVRSGVKYDLVGPGAERLALGQGTVASAVGIGLHRRHQRPGLAVQPEQVDPHAGGRAAMSGVENVGGQISHGDFQLDFTGTAGGD